MNERLNQLIESCKSHPIITIASSASIVAIGTFWIINYTIISPRDYTIAELRIKVDEQSKEIKELKEKLKLYAKFQAGEPESVQYFSINTGNAVTTKDGRCLISVSSVASDLVCLKVTIDASGSVIIDNIRPGVRRRVDSTDKYYTIDITGTRGGIADLNVSTFKKG